NIIFRCGPFWRCYITPLGVSDFLLEEVDAFLALEDDSTSPKVDHSYYDTKEDILLLEAFLDDDPSLPLPTQGMYLPKIRKELKNYEAKNDKSSVDEPPKEFLDFEDSCMGFCPSITGSLLPQLY
nr:reverse transcriptase domain-containing protein [Tanacetum cinerariifolium]